MKTLGLHVATLLAFTCQQFAYGMEEHCPPPQTIPEGLTSNDCVNSRNCPAREVCCYTPYGKKCVREITVSGDNFGPPPRPMPIGGTCDDGSLSTVSCSSHNECDIGKKCYAKWCCPNYDGTGGAGIGGPPPRPFPGQNIGPPPRPMPIGGTCDDGSLSTVSCSSHSECDIGKKCYAKWCCPNYDGTGGIGGPPPRPFPAGECDDGSTSRTPCSTDSECHYNQKCYGRYCCPITE